MTLSRIFSLMMILGLSPVLGGCAIADLAAYGVKAVEKRDRGSSGEASAGNPAPQSSPQAQADEPPPPVSAPAPRRSSVTAEELPAR